MALVSCDTRALRRDPAVLDVPETERRLPYELSVTEVRTYQRGETVAGPWSLGKNR